MMGGNLCWQIVIVLCQRWGILVLESKHMVCFKNLRLHSAVNKLFSLILFEMLGIFSVNKF